MQSAPTHLPPLNFKEKFWLATEDTFDYSDVIFIGGLAGISMAEKSQPSFGQGAAGYGRYYWHVFVDGAIENYMTEAIVPAATKEDPRYYTLGKGGFIKRTGYAVSRLLITRTDVGKNTFNISEIVGAGAAAGIGNAFTRLSIQPLGEDVSTLGNAIGIGRSVQRTKRVLAGHRSGRIPREILIPKPNYWRVLRRERAVVLLHLAPSSFRACLP